MIRNQCSGGWPKFWSYKVCARMLAVGDEHSGASDIEVRTLRSAVTLYRSKAAPGSAMQNKIKFDLDGLPVPCVAARGGNENLRQTACPGSLV